METYTLRIGNTLLQTTDVDLESISGYALLALIVLCVLGSIIYDKIRQRGVRDGIVAGKVLGRSEEKNKAIKLSEAEKAEAFARGLAEGRDAGQKEAEKVFRQIAVDFFQQALDILKPQLADQRSAAEQGAEHKEKVKQAADKVLDTHRETFIALTPEEGIMFLTGEDD